MSDRMKAIGWLKKGMHLENGPVGVMWSGNAFVGEVKDGKVYIDPVGVNTRDNAELVLPRRVIQAEVALQDHRPDGEIEFQPSCFGGDGKVRPPRSYVEEALALANSAASQQEPERSPDPLVRLEERLIQIRDLVAKLTAPEEDFDAAQKPLRPTKCLTQSEGHLTISIRAERFWFRIDEALEKLQMSGFERDADARARARKWIIDEILYGLSLEANR